MTYKEIAIVGFFLLFGLYAIGFFTGYYVGMTTPQPARYVPIEDLVRDNDASVLPDRSVMPVIVFRSTFQERPDCFSWSDVNLEEPSQ